MFISQFLKDFLADSSLTNSELNKKYQIEQLRHDVRDVLCHSICEFVLGRNISLTDLQTDLRDIVKTSDKNKHRSDPRDHRKRS